MQKILENVERCYARGRAQKYSVLNLTNLDNLQILVSVQEKIAETGKLFPKCPKEYCCLCLGS